jgi:hypothetical protein
MQLSQHVTGGSAGRTQLQARRGPRHVKIFAAAQNPRKALPSTGTVRLIRQSRPASSAPAQQRPVSRSSYVALRPDEQEQRGASAELQQQQGVELPGPLARLVEANQAWWDAIPSRHKIVLAGSLSFVICNMVRVGSG